MNVAPRFYEIQNDRESHKKIIRESHAMALVMMDEFDSKTTAINSFIAEPVGGPGYAKFEIEARRNMKRTEVLRDKLINVHSDWIESRNFNTCKARFEAAEKYLHWLLTPFTKDSIEAIYS